jgi:ribosomal-protein-serine acetyltransferase
MNFPLIVDDELQLHPVCCEHAEPLFMLVDENRDYLARWLPFPPLIKSVDDIAAFIDKSVDGWENKELIACLIVYLGKPAGIISFNKILKPLEKAEIGYWLAEPLQGKGIVTRACKRIIRFGFDELKLSKIEIRAARHNQPSRAVCERLGATLEGIITQSQNLHGEIIDHALYALHKP